MRLIDKIILRGESGEYDGANGLALYNVDMTELKIEIIELEERIIKLTDEKFSLECELLEKSEED